MDTEHDRFLESIVEGVVCVDFNEEHIIFANHTASEMLGYSREEFLAMELIALFPSNYYHDTFVKAIKSKESVKYLELELITKDRTLLSASFSISTFFDSRHTPLYKLVLIRSINEIELARQQGINQFRLFALNQLHLVLSRIEGGMGPMVVKHEPLPFVDARGMQENAMLMRLCIFYLTAVGQGSSYATGLFGPLPVADNKEYLSLVYTFFLKNPDNQDPRAKGKDYFILIIIIPKTLENLFGDRKALKAELAAFFEQIEFTKSLTAVNLEDIKRMVIFGSKPGISQKERLLERKLAAITDLSTEVSSMLDLESAFEYFTYFAEKVLDFKIFALLLLNESTRSLRIVACRGYKTVDLGFEIPINSPHSVTAKSAREKIVLNIPDVAAIDYYYSDGTEISSELAVPITLADHVVGILNIESVKKDAFDSTDERIMIALASQISNYLSRREFERKLRSIYEMQTVLAEAADQSQVYERITSFAANVLKFPIFSINIINKRKKTIDLVSSFGYDNPSQFTALPLEGESGVVRYAAVTGAELIAQDVVKDKRYLATDERVKSECAVPITIHSRVLGVLNAEKYQTNGFNQDDIGLLRALSKITGIFILQKSLELQLTALFSLAENLINISDVYSVLQELVSLVEESFDYEHFSISFVDHENDRVILAAYYGYSEDDVKRIRSMNLMSPDSLSVRAARERRTINIVDKSKALKYVPTASKMVLSQLAVPIFATQENLVIGVLNIESNFYRAFNQDDTIILERMARIISKTYERFPIRDISSLTVWEKRKQNTPNT